MANSIFVGFNGTSSDGSGNVTFSAAALMADGSITAPSLAYAAQPTTGWFRAGSQTWDFVLQAYSSSASELRLSNAGLTFGQNCGINFSKTLGASGTVNCTMFGFLNGTSQLIISNPAGTTGVGLDFSTNNLLLLRSVGFAAYATLDCLGLKASGVAGANFGPSAVASLTVVNGIVTAAS